MVIGFVARSSSVQCSIVCRNVSFVQTGASNCVTNKKIENLVFRLTVYGKFSLVAARKYEKSIDIYVVWYCILLVCCGGLSVSLSERPVSRLGYS